MAWGHSETSKVRVLEVKSPQKISIDEGGYTQPENAVLCSRDSRISGASYL